MPVNWYSIDTVASILDTIVSILEELILLFEELRSGITVHLAYCDHKCSGPNKPLSTVRYKDSFTIEEYQIKLHCKYTLIAVVKT